MPAPWRPRADAVTLPVDLNATPAALRHLMIRALDGRADIWVNLGNAELPPSVQLDIDDEAIAGPGERTTMGLSLSSVQARELIYALTVATEAAEGRQELRPAHAHPGAALDPRRLAAIRIARWWEPAAAVGALLLVADLAAVFAFFLFRN
jgi:hypothetical protein